MDSFSRFVGIIRQLLGENGCPRDRAQTHESLRPCMLEESYEVLDAINNKDTDNLKEELGDVLLQVVMHSLIAENNGEFTLDDTINGISDKMINRHPHVFGNEKADTAEGLVPKWEEIKKREKGQTTLSEISRGVAKALPALVRAQKIMKKTLPPNEWVFDASLEVCEDSLKKIKELKNGNNQNIDTLIGIFLVAFLNISNFFQINAEFSLTNAVETYITKLEEFENASAAVGEIIEDTRLEEADVFIEFIKEHQAHNQKEDIK